jgi:hypothetical protein
MTVWMPFNGSLSTPPQIVNFVEHFSDDVERRGKIRTADAEEDADRLADFRFQGMQLRQGADRIVKDEIFRPLVE